MKNIIILILLVFSSYDLFSKDKEKCNPIGIGPYLAFKMGINGNENPLGRKNGLSFNGIPDFGISTKIPINENGKLGVGFDLGYSTYSYLIKQTPEDGTLEYKHSYSYLTFGTNFCFDFVRLGFNFGIPMAADFGAEIDVARIASPLIEVRVGVAYPVLEDETGTLNVVFYAGYMLTGIYYDFTKDDPVKTLIQPKSYDIYSNQYNPHAASAMLGFSYLFNF